MPFLEDDSRKIYYKLTGAGPPLVLIHGMALDHRIWHDLPEFLAREYQVLTYDLRGHGQSFAPETGYSYREHVNDLKALLAELKFDRVNIVAHSLGGAVAIKYALQMPNRVRNLVLAAPHVVGYADYSDWPDIYRTARLIDIDQARISWETFRLFRNLKKGSPEKELFDCCLKNFPGRMWTDPKAGRYMDESDLKILDRLEVAVLLLCGRDDHDFLPLAKIINARVQYGSLFEIPDCSHMIYLEKPEIFKRELKAFFKMPGA
ncbi:MAG: alpha/beta hydrolase [candidate division Zixibacteria bacterium]|nr:alpha/beta hydrolase [candidate division Zixibacteria bacterium]